MHLKFQLFLLLTAFCFLVSCGGGPGERIRERAAMTPEPSPTPGERDISGSFLIKGSSANDADPYTGSLTVAPKGDNYEFRWATTKGTRVGTGVQLGSGVAANFAQTGGGKGCGVMLYHIGADGALTGKSALWGEEKYGTENAVRTKGVSLIGEYTITGSSVEGKDYTGSLKVTRNGEGYQFEWTRKYVEGGGDVRFGFGTWNGSSAASVFGGTQCGFALYDVSSNGSLEGYWSGQQKVTIGKEIAKRQ